MPFDKIKKIFNKQDDKKQLLEDGSGPSKQEIETEEKKEKFQQFLKKYNLDKQNIEKLHKYIEKVISTTEVKIKKEIEKYFAAQIDCINNFHSILQNQYKLEQDRKDIASMASHSPVIFQRELEKITKKIDMLTKQKNHYVDKYTNNKENIKKTVGFEDKGARLTIKGLIDK